MIRRGKEEKRRRKRVGEEQKKMRRRGKEVKIKIIIPLLNGHILSICSWFFPVEGVSRAHGLHVA
jgi:hypothetical protein